MAEKTNIRSIRFSDEVIEIIEQQQGRNFTEKFDSLVYNCYMLQSEKEKELARLDEQIQKQRERLNRIREDTDKIRNLQITIQATANKYFTELSIATNHLGDM